MESAEPDDFRFARLYLQFVAVKPFRKNIVEPSGIFPVLKGTYSIIRISAYDCTALQSGLYHIFGPFTQSVSIGTVQKVLLVDRRQDHGSTFLDDLVIQGRYAKQPLAAVRLGDLYPFYRLGLLDARQQLLLDRRPVLLQMVGQLLCAHLIDTGCAFVLLYTF